MTTDEDWDAAAPLLRDPMWTLEEAVKIAKAVNNAACPVSGFHVALTGGLLYKEGPRKDIDLLFYAPYKGATTSKQLLFHALGEIGFTITEDFGRVVKSHYDGRPVDLFFPEDEAEFGHGDYQGQGSPFLAGGDDDDIFS